METANEKLLTCACCGAKTIDEEGNYKICSLCFWEDDPIQRDDPDYKGGANEISLNQARNNFLEYGYCDVEVAKRMAYTPKK